MNTEVIGIMNRVANLYSDQYLTDHTLDPQQLEELINRFRIVVFQTENSIEHWLYEQHKK